VGSGRRKNSESDAGVGVEDCTFESIVEEGEPEPRVRLPMRLVSLLNNDVDVEPAVELFLDFGDSKGDDADLRLWVFLYALAVVIGESKVNGILYERF
jgi:hypothetical protein